MTLSHILFAYTKEKKYYSPVRLQKIFLQADLRCQFKIITQCFLCVFVSLWQKNISDQARCFSLTGNLLLVLISDYGNHHQAIGKKRHLVLSGNISGYLNECIILLVNIGYQKMLREKQ